MKTRLFAVGGIVRNVLDWWGMVGMSACGVTAIGGRGWERSAIAFPGVGRFEVSLREREISHGEK